MTPRPASLLPALCIVMLAQTLPAQPANGWRAFKKADGLPENACVSVTAGLGGNILVRHAKSSALTLFDGYDFTTVAATNRHRVFESPGGQLWSATPDGLVELREGEWVQHPVAQVAEHFRSGSTNEITLLVFRQGRVFILLPGELLQLDAEDADRAQVESFRRADTTPLGRFVSMSPATDGGAWIIGAGGFTKLPGPLRNLKPSDEWRFTNSTPAELSRALSREVPGAELPAQRVLDRALENGGVAWLAAANGLFRYAPELWQPDDSAPPDKIDFSVPSWIATNRELVSLADWKTSFTSKSGDVWLGGGNHVARWSPGRLQVFASTNQIGPEQVRAFGETSDGKIWCATADKVWGFTGNEWLMARGGFENIRSLLGARDGSLWTATERGLLRMARGAWLGNGTEDGLPSDDILELHEDATGAFRVRTAAGWSRFDPDADRDPPQARIRAAKENDLSFREDAIVRFEFAGRDKWKRTPPERLLFSYRLDDSEWSAFQSERELTFANLTLGRHYFSVRAMDRNGNISTRPAQVEFHIVLPWYRETRLVVVLAVALVIAMGFAALAFNRHRRLRRSYAEVERLVAERTRELGLANRELIHSQKMNALGTLSAGIAHDFNNILSIIKGSAQIIEDNADNPDKIRTRVDRIQTVVQQGAEVVEAMLGFSRSTDAPPAPCDINAVVAETRKLLGDRFLRETEVKFERGENLPEISVAKDFVQQILLNFIFNAAEAMDSRAGRVTSASAGLLRDEPCAPGLGNLDDGAHRVTRPTSADAPTPRHQITLTTRVSNTLPPGLALTPPAAANYILIAVRDNGSGIAPGILPRIFEPFFTTKAMSAKRGTGLGLSMVYELARKLGAGIAVETVVGRGSTFTVFLPLNPNPATATPPAA